MVKQYVTLLSKTSSRKGVKKERGILSCLLILFLMGWNISSAQLLTWNTFGNTGTETTEPSTSNNANVSAANLTLSGITPAANGNRLGGTNWFDTGNTSTAPGSTLDQAIAGNNYIQFVVTPASGFAFTATSFTFIWDFSGTGPKSVSLRSSVDGFAADLGSVTNMTTSTSTVRTITISGMSNIATATTFRLYGYNATATGGTGGFDCAANANNVVLNGSTVSTAPTISSSLTPASLTTTYGTASAGTTFNISGSNLTAGISVKPPVGFEVATTPDFSTTIGTNITSLVVGSAPSVSSTPVYVRLSATATAGNHTGNIELTSGSATLVNVGLNATNTVNPLGITITGLSVVDKTFDNTTAATLSGTASLVGVLPTDSNNVSLTGSVPVANFNDPTVGNNKPVSVTGYVLSGSAAANYSVTQPSLTGNILPSGLQDQAITFLTPSPVTYGVAPFTLSASSDSGLPVTLTSLDTTVATISGNTITVLKAGSVTIRATQAGNGSYNPAIDVNRVLVVDPKELTVTGAVAGDKIYDTEGTTSITGGILVGVINSDDVSLSGNGNFDDVNVGQDITVTANLFLSGDDAANYYLTQPTGLTADINPKGLTISGISISNKEYDTTDSATILGSPTLVGVEFPDFGTVTLGGSPTAAFNDSSVANNKPVTVSGYTISGSTNYYLSQPTGLTANITLKTLTIINLTAVNKVYDRTLTATLSGTASLSGVLPGDEANVSLSGTPTASFLTVTAGNNKPVSVTGYSLSGSSLANYTLAPLNLTANILKQDVTISGASVADKAYDGTTTATLSGSLSGVIDPDAVTLNRIAAFADENVGTNKPVTSNSTITGTDSGNYNLVQPTGLTASITASPCTQGPTGIVTWDFGTSAINAAPSANTTTGVTISNISTGNNLGTVAAPITTVSPSSGYTGATAQYNIGAATRIGALNTGASGSAYFEFTLTPTAGNITLTGISFGTRSTATAAQAYTLRSSADNYVADLATGTIQNNSAWSLKTPTVSGVSATSSPVTYRLFGYNGAGSPGSGTINWKIDDLKLTIAGAVSPALSSPSTANACSGANFTYAPTTTYTSSTITWTRASVAGISNAAVTTPQAGSVNETLVNTTNAPVAVVYTFKVTGNTCYVTGDVTVTVNPLPIVTASDVSGCAGSPIALSGSPAGGSYSVSNPYVGLTSTTYTYSYTDANGCSATSAPANITITAQPIYYLDADGDDYYTGAGIPSCTPLGPEYTTNVLGGNDCNDADDTIYPTAPEICWNGILENCTGTLSQGCAPVVVNMAPSYNNTTLSSLSQAIPAVPYSYGGFTNLKYRFSITNVTTGAVSADIIQTSRYINIPAALHSYPGAYDIKVSAVINEEIVPFAGNTIRVNAPALQLVTLSTASCGATLATLASTLTANPGPNATGYTFRIRLNDANPTPTYATSQSATRFIGANTFTGFPLQYASSYKVSVSYTYTDPVTSLPVESPYGAECTVNTPSIPLIGMASPTCGSTVTAMNANMSAQAASYATGYRFRIRLFADNGPTPTYYYTLPNASRFSSLTAFQGITLAYSTAYSISAEYSILNGSTTVWSGFGADCKVTTPFFPTTSLVPSQCGQPTATSLTQQLNITPYPGFPNYRVLLEEVSGEDVVNSQELIVPYPYFRLNQFSIAQNNKNYNVSVAIKQNGVFGNYSTACDINTQGNAEGGGITKTVVPFTATGYPNPFADNFMIDVKSASQSNVSIKVYDMIGRMIEQRDVRVSDMESTTIGNSYPSGVYNVVVSQQDSVQTVRVVKR